MSATSESSRPDTARARTFNVGDLFDLVAEAVPERIALVWRDERLAFAEIARRSDALAGAFSRAGVRRDYPVGMVMRNSPAFVEVLLALLKLGAVPFSINYRYTADEMLEVAKDAGARGLVYDADLAPLIDSMAAQLPACPIRMIVETWGEPPVRAGDLLSYLTSREAPLGGDNIVAGRRDDNRVLIYTGGTTGRPKGVEWEQRALFFGALGGGGLGHKDGAIRTPEAIRERAAGGYPYRMLGAGPLMHGASVYGAFNVLLAGATLVLPHSRSLDPELILDLAEREGVQSLSLMGDAMIRPVIAAWDAHPGRWTLPALASVGSGGGTMAEDTRMKLQARFPKLRIVNAMGSSESGTMGAGEPALGDGLIVMGARPDLAVIVDGARIAEAGEMGILARTGHLPLGYWNDPAKTAATFVEVDGRRWVLTGDRAKAEEDGRIRMYGRDSNVINTGGEKVFAEEVEIAVRSHPAVRDAVVTGVPDERWGQAVGAVICLNGTDPLSLEELRDHCAATLARYKLPQRIAIRDTVQRSPAGKADLRWARAELAGD